MIDFMLVCLVRDYLVSYMCELPLLTPIRAAFVAKTFIYCVLFLNSESWRIMIVLSKLLQRGLSAKRLRLFLTFSLVE